MFYVRDGYFEFKYAVEGRFKAKNSYVVWDCSQNSIV